MIQKIATWAERDACFSHSFRRESLPRVSTVSDTCFLKAGPQKR